MTDTSTPATLAELRAAEAATRDAWAAIPLPELLEAIKAEFEAPELRAALDKVLAEVRPMLARVPDGDPVKFHIQNGVAVLQGAIAQVIASRLAELVAASV